jgi:hypothetical protein
VRSIQVSAPLHDGPERRIDGHIKTAAALAQRSADDEPFERQDPARIRGPPSKPTTGERHREQTNAIRRQDRARFQVPAPAHQIVGGIEWPRQLPTARWRFNRLACPATPSGRVLLHRTKGSSHLISQECVSFLIFILHSLRNVIGRSLIRYIILNSS